MKEEIVLKEILRERISNSNIFSESEQKIILNSISLYIKVYLLAMIDNEM